MQLSNLDFPNPKKSPICFRKLTLLIDIVKLIIYHQLQLKAQDLQIKQQKTQADIQLEQQKLELEKEKLASHERIAGAQIGAKSTLDKERLQTDQTLQGARIGMEATFKKKEMEHRKQEMTINAVDKLIDHGHKQDARQTQKELSQQKPQE